MSSLYRYTSPIPKRAATGLVAATYAQIAEEFILTDGPLMSLSPAPDLLAATWALLREAQLAGDAPRINREVIAVAVSAANNCQFCVDAHAAMLHAAGAHQLAGAVWRGETPHDPEPAELAAWSQETAKLGKSALPWPPSSAEFAAEYLGTALVTHFINRIVEPLVHTSLLAGRLREPSIARREVERVFGRTMHRRLRPGESLTLLSDTPVCPPDWAAASPVGAAFAALRAAASEGGRRLSAPARDLVQATLASIDGRVTGRTLSDLTATLPDADRPGARLALLAAVAPHDVAETDVAAWRSRHPADADLVRLFAFGAFTAVARIEASLAPQPALAPYSERTGAGELHS